MLARERGAKAVLVVTGPNSPNAGELLPLTNDGTAAASGIVAASISGKTAERLLAPGGKTLKELQTTLDNENPHAEHGFILPKVKVNLECGVEHIRKTDRDIVGYLPGSSDEYVLVGAHYDHLGHGGNSSLDRAGEEGKIHPGADDNASGVAWVMEQAGALAQERAEHPERFKRGVIFACWSGEEIGLIGSAAFCEHPPVPLNKIVAYLNADMVGRCATTNSLSRGSVPPTSGAGHSKNEMSSQASIHFAGRPLSPDRHDQPLQQDVPALTSSPAHMKIIIGRPIPRTN